MIFLIKKNHDFINPNSVIDCDVLIMCNYNLQKNST